MKLTNETGLPAPLVRVAEKLVNSHPVFDINKYSVTECLKSTRQVVLAREHADEIVMDVQDSFSMWNGTAIHALLEAEASEDYEAEKRIEAEIDGVVISGGFDLFSDGESTLYDYKTSKVATIDRQRRLEETKWLEQLYLYKVLREKNGMSVPKKGVIIAMATDFSKIKADTQPGYPKHPIQILEWELNDPEFEEMAVSKAVSRATEARDYIMSGNEPPKCTFSDCWCREDWAIIKDEAKRAIRTFGTEDEARAFYETMKNKDDYRIFHRASEFNKCSHYCECLEWCEQGKRNVEAGGFNDDVTDELPF